MTNEPKALKAALRRQIYEAGKKFSAAELSKASEEICARLRAQAVWQEAESVMLFWPMPGETDIRPILFEALAAGKSVALPRFEPAEGAYSACQVEDYTADVKPGYYGIHEPLPRCPKVDLKRLDFFLVPGVGFSLDGGRLGRGKGYYDRMLAGVPGFKCGVAFDWQVAFAIPGEEHDICLNCILTPTRWHVVTSPGRF